MKRGEYATGSGILWPVEEKRSSALIGTVNYEKEAEHGAGITYDLARAYWGQGLMLEAGAWHRVEWPWE